MKTVIKRRWLGEYIYVEVGWRPATNYVEVRCMTRDPRKAQYRKVKYWNRGLYMPFRPVESAILVLEQGIVGRDRITEAALEIITKDLGLTSSVSRALVS